MLRAVQVLLSGWFLACLTAHLGLALGVIPVAKLSPLLFIPVLLLTVAGNYVALSLSGQIRERQSITSLFRGLGNWRFVYLGLWAYTLLNMGRMLAIMPPKGQPATPQGEAAGSLFFTSLMVVIAANSLAFLRRRPLG